MGEEFKYFISYYLDSSNIFKNSEIITTYINSLDDIKKIEYQLQDEYKETCTIIHYRVF